MPIDFGGALGGIGSFAGNMISSAVNSSRAWKYTQRAMALQDKYNRAYTRDQYGLMRQGLESAGYNPLLALGSSASSAIYSGSGINSDSDSGSQAVQSSIQAMQLRNENKLANANVKQYEANSALANEQAKTEQAKRVQMDFQNSMYDVQKHLAQKDLSWYDRKSYATLYNMFQQAENYRASSAIGAMNAETARQNMINDYKIRKYSSETERMNAYTNSKNARTNEYNADTNRGKRSFSGFGFNASFTPRHYNQGGYFMN